jgi:class 3 adenylate cyclase/predicted ATPase
MTFDDILAQVLTLLQREGRVSYRALKRRFDLNDEYLEDLKDEIIKAKRLAIDEEGSVLVWTGNTQETVSQPALTAQQPSAQAKPSPQVESPPAARRLPEAERRQLTVMFCDLVDSTQLSSRLDPEEYRDVVRVYQRVCSAIITRFDGHIAQLLGDGLLVYFGYPHAHEDDPHRAIRAALGILAAMGNLNTHLQREKGIQLGVRLGIHTGLVVIGDMGGGGRQEQLALGETPNIASRIQGRAEPNTLAISEATYRLVEGYFTCESLGEHTLRGVSQPLHIYRVLGESGVHSRLEVAQTRGLTPLVGREQEVGLLLERWQQAKFGQGQVVLLTGDAGIGKSRLVQVLKEHVINEPHTRWECRSSEYYQNTALFPLVDLFQRLLRFQVEDTPDQKVGKLEHMLSKYRLPLEESVQLFAPLLSLPISENRYPLLNLSPQRQRQKTLETIIAILLELAERQPVLFILEDLHWTDPTTLELLNLLIDQTPTASLLVLLTCRPHFQPAWHHRSYLTEITVNRLSHTQVEQIVHRLTDGKTLPTEVLQQIIAKTDGVPLFVEEMTKAILESGQLTAIDGHYEHTGSFSTFAIPATLQDSLMARLDRLVSAKGIAQLAAVIGRQFSYELLQAVSQLDASTLQRDLGRLVEAELLYQRGLPPQTTYIFKHALIQDAAYESLLRSTRQQYHQWIAQVLEEHFPETAEAQPELLAHHYTEARMSEHAMPYWQRAGERAVQRSAYVEAINHLTKGLEALQALPDTPARLQHELVMQTTLGSMLMATKGWGAQEVEHAYARARELCRQVGDMPQLSVVLLGLRTYYLMRVELRTARELVEQQIALVQRQPDPTRHLLAHYALDGVLFYLGEFVPVRRHLLRNMALYTSAQQRSLVFHYGFDLGVTGLAYVAMALWGLGYPDQARTILHKALALAQEVSHPFSRTSVLQLAAIFHYIWREEQRAQERAEAMMVLATEQEFPLFVAAGTCWRGQSLLMQGQAEAGLVQMQQGLAAWRATGGELAVPWWLALLAEAHGITGKPETGLTALTEALTLADTTGERWYESELYRLKGALLLQQSSDNQVEAEACFHKALDIARSQQAKSFELRTATSLARLWQQQGKRQEAHDLLAPVYGWFTEGFDTADLKDAKALLDELT